MRKKKSTPWQLTHFLLSGLAGVLSSAADLVEPNARPPKPKTPKRAFKNKAELDEHIRLETLGLEKFINEALTPDPESVTQAAVLYDAYIEWLSDKFPAVSKKKFGEKLVDYYPKTKSGAIYYHGVRPG